MESTLRTANNLLERLHASFFFYILTTPHTFLSFGSFLPSVLLVSVSLLVGGLLEYVDAGWVEDIMSEPKTVDASGSVGNDIKWLRTSRPVLAALFVMLWCHLAGALFYLTVSWWPVSVSEAYIYQQPPRLHFDSPQSPCRLQSWSSVQHS